MKLGTKFFILIYFFTVSLFFGEANTMGIIFFANAKGSVERDNETEKIRKRNGEKESTRLIQKKKVTKKKITVKKRRDAQNKNVDQQIKKKKKQQKKSSGVETYFSITSTTKSEEEKIKHAIISQAKILVNNGLQEIGVSKNKADEISSKIIELGIKAHEIKSTLNAEIIQAQQHRKELESLAQKNPEKQNELKLAKEKEELLIKQKREGEDFIGIAATSLANVMSEQAVGSQTNLTLINLFEQMKVPGTEYGKIISKITSYVIQGAQKLKEDNFSASLNPYTVYYSGIYRQNVGGWLFGQDITTGKMYVRLDRPSFGHDDHVYVEHREIKLKNTTPFMPLAEQMAEILAGNFELGHDKSSFHSQCLSRNMMSTIF